MDEEENISVFPRFEYIVSLPAIALEKIIDLIIKIFNMKIPAQNIHSNIGFAKGLRPVDPSKAHLKFGDFLIGLPPAPLVYMAPALSYPMDHNDTTGICVVAGWDHYRQIVTQLLMGKGQNFTDNEIWAFYKTQNPNFDPTSTATLYGPGSSSDNGMNIQQFLQYLQANKYILGFAKIDYTNPQELQAAVYIGLSIITGLTLDMAQMDQFSSRIWDNVPGSPVDGGHCVPLGGYPASGATCVTWAELVALTQTFILKQMTEAWFVLTQAHVDHPNFRNNFDLAGFSKAVNQITGGQVVIPVPPAPVPTPTPIKPSFKFLNNLSAGMTNSDVLQLQKCLNYNPATALKALPGQPGSIGHETTFFGPVTFNAVKVFQSLYGLSSIGLVGPTTRNQLNFLFSGKLALVDAVIHVESGGNDMAQGDLTLPDHAYGALQIRQGVVDQVNIKLGTTHKSQECLGNRALSLLIWNTYWTIFTDMVTDQDKCFCWNGGPYWRSQYKKAGYEGYTALLDAYWAKVSALL